MMDLHAFRRCAIALAVAVLGLGVADARARSEVHPVQPPTEDQALALWADRTFGDALAQGRFSGMSLVVLRGDAVVLQRVYGLADYDPRTEIDAAHTRFLIGSISKTFTGIAILQLVEAGKIKSIDDPINVYLKRLQLTGDRGAHVTVKDLLTHSAGYEARNWGTGTARTVETPVTGPEAERYAPGLVREPGRFVSYSNYSTALLGLAVEDVSGQPIEDYFRDNIWGPLGMESARFQRELTLDPRVAEAHRKGEDGQFTARPFIAFHPLFWPVGAVAVSLEDATGYLRFHLDRARGLDGPVLSVRQHQTLRGLMRSNHPDVGGFGFQIMTYDWNGRTLFGHGGTWIGYESMVLVSPKDQSAYFFSIAGPRGLGNIEASNLISSKLWGADGPPRAVVPTSPDQLADFAGLYRPVMRSDTTIEGALPFLGGGDAVRVEVSAEGLTIAGDGPFLPLGGDAFYRAEAKQTAANPFAMSVMAFVRGEDGEVRFLSTKLGFVSYERVPAWRDPAHASAILMYGGWILAPLGLLAIFWPASGLPDRALKAAASAPGLALILATPVLALGHGPGGLGAYLIEGRAERFTVAHGIANVAVACAALLVVTAIVWWWRGGRPLWVRLHATLLAALSIVAAATLLETHLAGLRLG